MSYEISFETHSPSRAWFSGKARDALAGFACEAARDAGATATPLTLSELYARCGRARTA